MFLFTWQFWLGVFIGNIAAFVALGLLVNNNTGSADYYPSAEDTLEKEG